MASVAQIQANRSNAQKSTGPRTAEGKERASQNALKHGLLAREAVIAGEDPEESEIYREGRLQDLAPAGAVEAMLAERVVGLSWRLRRAERLQNAAFAAPDEGEPTDLLEARHEEWKQLKGSAWDRGLAGLFDEDAGLGKAVVADFAEARVLDRLLMYERRIESSLYRTMSELRRERQARAAAVPEEVSCSEGAMTLLTSLTAEAAAATEEVPRSERDLPAGEEAASPVKLGSFGANVAPESHTRETAFESSEPLAGVARDTGPLPVAGNHGRDAHATGTAARIEQSCETNPIPGGTSSWGCQVLGQGGGRSGFVWPGPARVAMIVGRGRRGMSRRRDERKVGSKEV